MVSRHKLRALGKMEVSNHRPQEVTALWKKVAEVPKLRGGVGAQKG